MFLTNMHSILFFLLVVNVLHGGLSDSESDCSVVSRRDWGANHQWNQILTVFPITRIFIHQTETSPCDSPSSCGRLLRSIQNYHMYTKGWDDIGYNFLIGDRTYMGRGWYMRGAHTFTFNHRSLGIAVIGTFNTNTPSYENLEAIKALIRCADTSEYLSPNYTIHGHRDAVCTDCPGQAFYDIIKTWDKFQEGPLPGYICDN